MRRDEVRMDDRFEMAWSDTSVFKPPSQSVVR